MQVVKRSGEREEFSSWKTITSIMRSGVPRDEAEGIVEALEPHLYNGITTEEIYRRVHQMLKGRKAAHYTLKKALLRLGPEGENFETYVARLFQAEGYSTKTRQILSGRCIKHEVDVLMVRDHERAMVECKFHNYLGIKCSIQIPLYVYARFLDLKERERLDRAVIVTNTRFSMDALSYARCVGMEVIGWSGPEGNGIESMAERHRLFPVTMLEMPSRDQDALLSHHFIVVDDVLARTKELSAILTKDSAEKVLSQAREILSG